MGRGPLAKSGLCDSSTICEQSPEFCESGKKRGPIFECDFLSPVGEALDRVVGIIDAVQEIEVNKIRPLDPENCVMDNDLLIPELRKKWRKKFNKKAISKEAIKNHVESKSVAEEDCFIIEYAIQVSTDAKLVNGQSITQSLDEATDLLLA